MKLILDSHVLVWIAEDTLSESEKVSIGSADAAYFSAASIWELEIKRKLGRLRAPEDLAERATAASLKPLMIDVDHAKEAGRLALHHRDPFDRMLVAQARVEGLTLATADEALAAYDIPVLKIERA